MSGDLMSILNARSNSMGGAPTPTIGKGSQPALRQGGGAGSKQGDARLAFDEADFPSLGGGPANRLTGSATNSIGGGGIVGGSTSHSPGGPSILGGDSYGALQLGSKSQEFNIQAEEFPALPGASRPGADSDTHKAEDSQSGRDDGPALQPSAVQPGHPDYEDAMRFYALQRQQQEDRVQLRNAMDKGSANSGGDGSGLMDQFGLMGLLNVIRMTDPDLTMLALGTDLTTLGLNLNSSDSLHKTFGSPWSDAPLSPEPDFKVPRCYLHKPPRLQAGYFAKFQQDTLFYIFYSMPSDEAQLLAADELSARHWWYHKDFKLWLTRIPNTEPIMKTPHFERGSYLVFDTSTWDAVRKDNFVVYYDSLERPPDLPRSPVSGVTVVGPGASALKPLGSASNAGLAPGSAL